MELSGFVRQYSFLTQLSPEEYTKMIDEGQMPSLTDTKVHLLKLTAKICDYAVKIFFLCAAGCIFAYTFRSHVKYTVGLALSILGMAFSSHMTHSIHRKLSFNEKFKEISGFNQNSTPQERLNALSQYWQPKPKEKPSSIDSLQAAEKNYNIDTLQRYHHLQSAFYAAMADLHDQPVHAKRFEDIFILRTPIFYAYSPLTLAVMRTKTPLTYLSLQNQENSDLSQKVNDLGEACFKSLTPEHQPDNLKSLFIEILQKLK